MRLSEIFLTLILLFIVIGVFKNSHPLDINKFKAFITATVLLFSYLTWMLIPKK